MQISVVIPTCNRKQRLLDLLQCLNKSEYRLKEVIIVDSGEDRLPPDDYSAFDQLSIQYVSSEKSVCIQRNIGIRKATSPWIFICDDDIEPPPDYLSKLMEHINKNVETGAVSGLVLQKDVAGWKSAYPLTSGRLLLWKFIFQLSIWGPIQNQNNSFIMLRIKHYYAKKGNHISKSGWPVITCFSDKYFETPVYGLGASLIKREWLLNTPYDEVLDRHGIGDNYAVAVQFPACIHVVTNAFVYHHQEDVNRLQNRLVYFRRALALDYFRQTIPSLNPIKKRWLLWSLTGNFLSFVLGRQFFMLKPAFKSIVTIALGKNPYKQAAALNKKVTEPVL